MFYFRAKKKYFLGLKGFALFEKFAQTPQPTKSDENAFSFLC
jgi:hypothetical protein